MCDYVGVTGEPLEHVIQKGFSVVLFQLLLVGQINEPALNALEQIVRGGSELVCFGGHITHFHLLFLQPLA